MNGRRWAGALGALCVLTAGAALLTTVLIGWNLTQALDAFVISNLLIGLSFGVAGAVIAWHRPRLALGWLFGAGGLCQILSALAAPMAEALRDGNAPTWLVRLDLTVFMWAWPINIGVAIPLALLLLPDGRLASRAWRPVFVAVAVTAPLFVLEVGLDPETRPGFPPSYFTIASYDDLAWLWVVSEVRLLLSLLAGVLSLGMRYRRGSEEVRRQILWLLAAAAVVLVAVTPWALVAGTPVAVLFAIPLIPASVVVAVLRHRLLDIRLVVARGVTYVLLSGLVLGAYIALVALLSTGVVSALIVALLALPLRSRLQHAVDRLLYGERSDPVRVASRVGRQLPSGLEETLEEVRTALRLPGVGVTAQGAYVARAGSLEGATEAVPLVDGSLVVGLRAGERRLDDKDSRTLLMLAGPLSVALHAMRVSEELRASSGRLVVAREEERRRLRRDLHDGLGPLLTGIALSADAADNLAARAPDQAAHLVRAVRSDTRSALSEVRRIIEDLRPSALDDLGLVAALRTRTAQTGRRSDGAPLTAVLEAPEELPPLPAAVEVAAYRIATEALINAVRHSTASSVVVRLTCDTHLHVEVRDDGGNGAVWQPGVGITGMRERVAELGGRCAVGPGPDGGRVEVSLPLVSA